MKEILIWLISSIFRRNITKIGIYFYDKKYFNSISKWIFKMSNIPDEIIIKSYFEKYENKIDLSIDLDPKFDTTLNRLSKELGMILSNKVNIKYSVIVLCDDNKIQIRFKESDLIQKINQNNLNYNYFLPFSTKKYGTYPPSVKDILLSYIKNKGENKEHLNKDLNVIIKDIIQPF